MNCRHCGAALVHRFVDLGYAPPSNAYRSEAQLSQPETTYPLRVFVCVECWLVQTEDFAQPEQLFDADYAYFSSVSTSWAEHAAAFAHDVVRRLGLGPSSSVVEIGSNDGYLLRHFISAGIPCLGVEPTASTAAAAERAGVPVIREFFSEAVATSLARERGRADLLIANNVYAHVPDIDDFTRGLRALLAPGGTVSLEFPHLMRLIEHTQFDTIYHEHYSYLSLTTVGHIFAAAGLRVLDVQELSTHGGSLRVFGCHRDDPRASTAAKVALLDAERRCGLLDLATYQAFQPRVEQLADDFVLFLVEQKRRGKRVAGYGAAAKGNTLINFAGVRRDLLPYVCDAAPSKQHKYLPGSQIPVLPPDVMRQRKPDVVVILPWNIAAEVLAQERELAAHGVQFAVAVPQVHFVSADCS